MCTPHATALACQTLQLAVYSQAFCCPAPCCKGHPALAYSVCRATMAALSFRRTPQLTAQPTTALQPLLPLSWRSATTLVRPGTQVG